MRVPAPTAARDTWAITRKEVRGYLSSPPTYLVLALFLGFTGYYFVDSISTPFAEASAAGYLVQSARVLGLWTPLLTMRLLAEEEKLGTIELLRTAPVRDWSIVLGKYLASLTLVVFTVGITLYYVAVLSWFGAPDPGPVLTGYLGLLLYAGAAVAIGLFASSLTSNQLVAAGIALTLMLFVTIADQAADVVRGVPAEVLNGISFEAHYLDFALGIVDTSSLIFFGSVTIFFVGITTIVLGSRRWH